MNIDKKLRMARLATNTKTAEAITVTHVTIRQSIFFLLLKLFALEIISAITVTVFNFTFFSTDTLQRMTENFSLIYILLFVVFVIIKSSIMAYVVIHWVDEYYEITPKELIYKKGLIFKKSERHMLNHLGSLKLEQGVLGRIFNYGSLKLFNWAQEKELTVYLIHNPMKYYHVLKTLLPEADVEKQVFREQLLEKETV